MDERVKPCPWCGGREIYFEDDALGKGYMYCVTCWAQSPKVEGGRGGYMRALSAWNRRAR